MRDLEVEIGLEVEGDLVKSVIIATSQIMIDLIVIDW